MFNEFFEGIFGLFITWTRSKSQRKMGTVFCFMVVISITFEVNCERWSRQITEPNFLPSEINDWIPLTESCPTCQAEDRSKNARVLNYPQNQMFHNSFNSASQQSPLSFSVSQPRKFSQFGLPAQKQSRPMFLQQHPTSQSFFQFEMPAYQADGNRQHNLPSVHTGYQIHHSGGQPVISSSLFSNNPDFPANFHSQFRPQEQALKQQKNIQQNFVEQQNVETKTNKQFETLSPPRLSTYQQQFQNQNGAAHTFLPHFPFNGQPTFQDHTAPKEEEVQLLYVPYDTLYQQRNENLDFDENKYNIVSPTINPGKINDFYTSEPVSKAPITTTSTARPTPTYHPLLHPTFTTPKPKLRPHQPTLAIFMIGTDYQTNDQAVKEIAATLQIEKSIAVLDTPSISTSPPVFIGPAGLPKPSGYIKLDLPYLSGIDPMHIDKHPFYVAPFSYRTPSGFTKIALPKPHVGSLIVNGKIDGIENGRVQQLTQFVDQFPQQESKQMSITSLTNTRHQNITPSIATSQAIKQSDSFLEEYTTNQQYYQPEQVTSPQPHIRTDEYQLQAKQEQIIPYTNFKPALKHIVNEEYFTARIAPPTGASPTTVSTSTLSPGFNENFSSGNSAEVEISPSISTHLGTYEVANSGAQQEHRTEINPSISTDLAAFEGENAGAQREHHKTDANNLNQLSIQNEDEYKMKTYFREQEAFRSRPVIHENTPSSILENIQYTPVSVDYDNNLYKVPASPSSYFDEAISKPAHREKITFYTPSVLENEDETNAGSYTTESTTITTTPVNIAENHRPNYNDNIYSYNYNFKPQEVDQSSEYEPNPYQLPSELPPLTSNLPGLVNALIEAEKLNATDKITTDPISTSTTTTTTERPIRNPITRRRRPFGVKTPSSSSVSYSSDFDNETTTRRSITRSRGHYNPRIANPSTTVPSTATSKTPLIRNPNKIRYKPSTEERQYFRRRRPHSSNVSSQKSPKVQDNIEYQRDVLNQNYPVFNASATTPTITMPTTSSTAEGKQIYQETPSPLSFDDKGQKETFASLSEPMKIAQEYQQVPNDNYGPGYFPNEEMSETQVPEVQRNLHPIYTTTPAVSPTTRRPPLIRRTSRPARTTTQATPDITTVGDERYTVRPRIRSEYGLRARTVTNKVRLHKSKSSPTTTSEPDAEASETSYHKVNRFNQDFYQDDYREENKEGNHRRKFNFDAQESQWSPSLSPSNGFQPIEPDQKAKFLRQFDSFEDEPEIVTAGSLSENDDNNENSFLFKVSAELGPSAGNDSKSPSADRKFLDNSTNTSFIDMLKEIMSDIEKDDARTEERSLQVEKTKTDIKTRRKGVWRKVRVHQNDAIETAESQNIGKQFYLHNSVRSQNMEKDIRPKPIGYIASKTMNSGGDYNIGESTTTEVQTEFSVYDNSTILSDSVALTTDAAQELTTHIEKIPITNSTRIQVLNVLVEGHEPVASISPEIESSTVASENYGRVTESVTEKSREEESAVYANDDLETQPSLFDEVESQLGTLVAIKPTDDLTTQLKPHRQRYTTILRTRPQLQKTEDRKVPEDFSYTTELSPFRKSLPKSIVYATSTSREITHETEICYRGKCIKSNNQS